MKIIHTAKELGAGKVCLAVGVFDGVHLGHQQVIRQTMGDAAQREARSVVVTFDQHPNAVVAPARLPLMIQTLPQRLRMINSLGVDATLILKFDHALSRLSAEDFISGLAQDVDRLLSVCVGRNFTFGYRRGGNVDLLKQLGTKSGFQVHGLAALALDDIPVSSTRIREALQTGQLDLASQMLGRPYSLCGTVVPGDKLGRQLGFPTANINVPGLALPATGVYAIHARTHSAPPDLPHPSTSHRGVLNIGTRPTLSEPTPQLRVEAHLLDFDGDLYGCELEVTPLNKLREEQKFPSVEALRAQIQHDVAQARR